MPLLLDELVGAFERLGRTVPAEPEICYEFADLFWDRDAPWPDESEIARDPAFELRTERRWLVLHRIRGEVRYYAAPRAHLARLFSTSELGIFPSAEDAARFAAAYLGDGTDFDGIDVPRREPEWLVESRRREDPWPPFDPAGWKALPCTSGRLATREDVDQRRALFVLRCLPVGHPLPEPEETSGHGMSIISFRDPPETPEPIGIPLPRCALLREGDEAHPVIAFQAERTDSGTYVAIRFIRGTAITRPLERLELLDGPTERFHAEYREATSRGRRDSTGE